MASSPPKIPYSTSDSSKSALVLILGVLPFQPPRDMVLYPVGAVVALAAFLKEMLHYCPQDFFFFPKLLLVSAERLWQ